MTQKFLTRVWLDLPFNDRTVSRKQIEAFVETAVRDAISASDPQDFFSTLDPQRVRVSSVNIDRDYAAEAVERTPAAE